MLWVPILWRVFIDSLLNKKNFEKNRLFLLCSWFCKVFVSYLNSIFFLKNWKINGILLKIYDLTLSLSTQKIGRIIFWRGILMFFTRYSWILWYCSKNQEISCENMKYEFSFKRRWHSIAQQLMMLSFS